MAKWNVQVTRISYATKVFTVEANEAWAAQEDAIRLAEAASFPEAYSVDHELGETREAVEFEKAVTVNAWDEIQEGVLRELKHHGMWFPGCNWYWDTPKLTERTLDMLVARGLADVRDAGGSKMYTPRKEEGGAP